MERAPDPADASSAAASPLAASPSDVSPAPARTWKSRLGDFAVFAVICSIILGVWEWKLDQYRDGLTFRERYEKDWFRDLEYPKLTDEEIVQLGTAHFDQLRPSSSYLFKDEKKAPGTTRIGVFGCSFTFGAEVSDGRDFSSLWEKKLNALGRGKYEVINFGVGGYGIHQSYLMWEILGKKYDLDVVLFNVFPFHKERDQSFIHTANSYGPVHARYVLDGDGLSLVEAVGEDRIEASKRYFSLFPPLRYLRYDADTPALLKAWLPKGQTLPRNPFYYYPGDLDEESEETYRRIHRELAKQTDRLIILCNDPEICKTFQDENLPKTEQIFSAANRASQRIWAIYRAPEAHFSAMANEFIAQELLRLMDENAAPPAALEPCDGPPPPLPSMEGAPGAFREIVGAKLTIQGVKVANYMVPGIRRALGYDLNDGEFESLLQLGVRPDLRFIGLQEKLEGDTLFLKFQIAGREESVEIGRVESNSAIFGRIALQPGLQASGGGWSLSILEWGYFLEDLQLEAPAGIPATLWAGKTKLLDGTTTSGKHGNIRWKAPDPGIIFARAFRDQDPHFFPEGETGTLDVALRYGGRAWHIPAVCWKVRRATGASSPEASTAVAVD